MDKKRKKLTKKEKQNKQIMWAIILMISLILIILLVPFIVKNYINKFVFINLDFQKTKLGNLMFYSTRFPVVNNKGEIIGTYAINFRNDPRKLEQIDVDVPNKTIIFMKNHKGGYNPVYISLDPKMEPCEDNSIAMINLAGFLRDSGLEVKSAVSDEEYAKKNNLKYATCLNSPMDTVIRVKSSNESSITKIMKNCYEITYKDCEIIQATEKFTLIILEEYMSHFREIK